MNEVERLELEVVTLRFALEQAEARYEALVQRCHRVLRAAEEMERTLKEG